MILVTHSRDEAYKFCGHLTILDSGQALTTGETKKLFERPVSSAGSQTDRV